MHRICVVCLAASLSMYALPAHPCEPGDTTDRRVPAHGQTDVPRNTMFDEVFGASLEVEETGEVIPLVPVSTNVHGRSIMRAARTLPAEAWIVASDRRRFRTGTGLDDPAVQWELVNVEHHAADGAPFGCGARSSCDQGERWVARVRPRGDAPAVRRPLFHVVHKASPHMLVMGFVTADGPTDGTFAVAVSSDQHALIPVTMSGAAGPLLPLDEAGGGCHVASRGRGGRSAAIAVVGLVGLVLAARRRRRGRTDGPS